MIENVDFVICPICKNQFKQITTKHLKHHNITIDEFKIKYPKNKLLSEKTFSKRSEMAKNIKHFSFNKGKTNIEIYGEQKAKEISEKSRISNTGKKRSLETCKNISKSHIGKKLSKEHKIKISNGLKGKMKGISYIEIHGEEKAKEICEKISKSKKGRSLSEKHKYKISLGGKGRKHSNEFKERQRQYAIERIENNKGYSANYNPDAIPIFQEFKKMHNLTNCYFARNPHEWHVKGTTYSLDFIDFDLKLIIEVDEKHHEKPIQKAKDEIRENKIKELFPDFIFLRFKEKEMNKILKIKIGELIL